VHLLCQTKGRSLDRHAQELPHLIPLSARPFDAAEVVYQTVNAEGFVMYHNNFYAAPWRLIRQPVAVRITKEELVIHDRTFMVVVRHRLFPKRVAGERSDCQDHEAPRDSQCRLEELAKGFRELGTIGSRFLEGLLASSRSGKKWVARLLAHGTNYPHHDVVSALERAARYGAFSLAAM
jgi:Mu transposase, C-terminal domain